MSLAKNISYDKNLLNNVSISVDQTKSILHVSWNGVKIQNKIISLENLLKCLWD